jgi:hypothetical protein
LKKNELDQKAAPRFLVKKHFAERRFTDQEQLVDQITRPQNGRTKHFVVKMSVGKMVFDEKTRNLPKK